MVKPIYGKEKILMFRLLEDEKKNKAAKLALQIEHTLTYERSIDSTQTKDGAITSDGGLEVSMEINAVASDDEVNQLLKKSVLEQKTLECWEINLASEREGNKYDALYMRGKLENWELPANVEDLAEISTTMKIDGIPQTGEVTLSQEDKETALYKFRTLEKVVDEL